MLVGVLNSYVWTQVVTPPPIYPSINVWYTCLQCPTHRHLPPTSDEWKIWLILATTFCSTCTCLDQPQMGKNINFKCLFAVSFNSILIKYLNFQRIVFVTEPGSSIISYPPAENIPFPLQDSGRKPVLDPVYINIVFFQLKNLYMFQEKNSDLTSKLDLWILVS